MAHLPAPLAPAAGCRQQRKEVERQSKPLLVDESQPRAVRRRLKIKPRGEFRLNGDEIAVTVFSGTVTDKKWLMLNVTDYTAVFKQSRVGRDIDQDLELTISKNVSLEIKRRRSSQITGRDMSLKEYHSLNQSARTELVVGTTQATITTRMNVNRKLCIVRSLFDGVMDVVDVSLDPEAYVYLRFAYQAYNSGLAKKKPSLSDNHVNPKVPRLDFAVTSFRLNPKVGG